MTSATAPNDLTLAIGYTNPGIATYGTIDVAIDSTGNAWISTANTTSTLTGLIEISPAGVFLSPANGFGTSVLTASVGIAVDQSGLIWVADNSGGTLMAFNSNGNLATKYTGIISPNGEAIDGNGDIWTSAGGNGNNAFQVLENFSGAYSLAATYTAASHFGTGICITPTVVYETAVGATNEPSQVTVVNLSTGSISATIDPDSGNAGLTGCAVDHAGNLYLPDFGSFNGVEVYNSSGSLLRSIAVPNTSAVASTPQEMAIDGLGNSLVATYSYNQAASSPSTAPEP
jgi:sugar lactone lactonase YvrE